MHPVLEWCTILARRAPFGPTVRMDSAYLTEQAYTDAESIGMAVSSSSRIARHAHALAD